ncbi:hypothetical protein [Pedobacter mucosus]|uniref:hypothetical protein n=1 Tax=Pedobacter mucosus TaxID=2895286 RepID=UPI001EE46A51|nr:hypothetical protein [Pedobacter mucosus]UKT64993.1 hypothetical protein LOK61_04265 [Pedobacter mucosus]
MKFRTILLIFAALAVLGCKKSSPDNPTRTEILNENFADAPGSWIVDFADYPTGVETAWGLKGEIRNLPAPLNITDKGLMVSALNSSDDIFMFAKKKVVGLMPNHTYKVSMEIEFASNSQSGLVGVGGAPDAVYLKAGLTSLEPLKALDNIQHYRLNLDKGKNKETGKDIFFIDNIGNGILEPTYKLLTKTASFTGTTNDKGEAWMTVGTDSGYESTTTLYYTKIRVSVEP